MLSVYVYYGSENFWNQGSMDMPSMRVYGSKEGIVCFSIEQMRSMKSKKKQDIA